MDHKLTVEDELFERLLRSSQQSGRSPKEIAAGWLQRYGRAEQDPLLALAGSFEFGLTDVSERHDEYLGQALRQELNP